MPFSNEFPDTRPSLILRLQHPDDVLAWEQFIEIYQPLIRSLAIRFGLQKADSDDVTQEVLKRVARHVANWDRSTNRSSFRGWLATITKNQTMEFFRQRNRRPVALGDSPINQVPARLEESDFDLEHARQIFLWAAHRVQGRFEKKTWEAFWTTAIKGESPTDCARRLDISVAQVYVARSRVMKALRLAVEKSEFEFKQDWRAS